MMRFKEFYLNESHEKWQAEFRKGKDGWTFVSKTLMQEKMKIL